MSLQSMTGYASAQTTLVAEGSSEGSRLGLEIRSVNSRFLDVSFRLPEELRQHEPALRELIGQHIKRGKVELRAYFEAAQTSTIAMPDKALLQKLMEIQQLVRGTMHDAPLLSVAEVIRLSHGPMTPNQDWAPQVMALGQQAVTQLCEARQREGQRLAVDLLQRAQQLQALAELALPLVPKTVETQRLRFLERWRDAMALVDAQSLPDTIHERAMAEAASFAVRADVAEEVTRLKTHLDEIARLLQQASHKEGVGKRLDFLIQELHREANTLGSKASAIEMTRISLDMKVLIEQMREQVQNLE